MTRMEKMIALLVLIVLALALTGCQESEESKYKSAQSLMAQGKYGEAAEKFEALGSYEEASKLTMYCKAAAAGENGDYQTAFSGFRTLGEYKDSPMMIIYYKARQSADGPWRNKLEAAKSYEQNALFRDSATRAENCRKIVYDEALSLRNAGDYDGACARLKELGHYQNAASQIPEIRYEQGEAKRAAKDWDGAVAAFEEAGRYSDAAAQIKETRYQEAESLRSAKKYDEAYVIYAQIVGYKNVNEIIKNDADIAAAKRMPYKKTGSVVTFGTYPQTTSSAKNAPIEWIVLDVQGNKALLISKYGLDARPYNTGFADVTWETCTLRIWLNNDFYRKAYSEKEQQGILITSIDNGPNQGCSRWSSNGGNNTLDRLFLLSCAEANKYFNVTIYDNANTGSRVEPTAYAKEQGAYDNIYSTTTEGKAAGWWWLRSPGESQHGAAGVDVDGSLNYDFVNYASGCVRPAFWLDLDADIF